MFSFLPFRHLSIKLKLMLIIMITSTIALLLACAAFLTYDLIAFRASMVERLSILAESIGINSSAALSFNVPGSARDILGSLRAEPHVMSAYILRADGTVFASYQRNRIEGKPLAAKPQDKMYFFDDRSLHLFSPIDQAGEKIGTVYLQSDLEAIDSRI